MHKRGVVWRTKVPFRSVPRWLQVVEGDVIKGVTYMFKQLRRVSAQKPRKDRRLSFMSRKSAASADPLKGLPVVLVISVEGVRAPIVQWGEALGY